MYVKLTQDQLDEIQNLLDTKNKKIKELQSELDKLKLAKTISEEFRARINFLEKDNEKMADELDSLNTHYKRVVSKLNKSLIDNDKIKKQFRNSKIQLNCLTNELLIQKDVNKKAVQMLNESKYIPNADLSKFYEDLK